MQPFPSREQFQNDPASASLFEGLRRSDLPDLDKVLLYKAFPLYRDDEGGLIAPDCLLLSPNHGVIAFALVGTNSPSDSEQDRCIEIAEQVPSYVHSKLVKNKALRKSPTQLQFEITPIIYAPFAPDFKIEECECASDTNNLLEILQSLQLPNPIDDKTFSELVSSVDGAKGLIRPVKREAKATDLTSKGSLADRAEAAIMLFDSQQKHGMMGRITGPQRIRGLAGSGKTVVLAMKAALTLLQNPKARIAYTFYTKSLYQHVKRLITRFYRQFDDSDPNWESNMHILHGWGGSGTPGLYSTACEKHNVPSLSFQEAGDKTGGDRFDYACKALIKQTVISPLYDYIFIDEGQDFPNSFTQLCHRLARDGKFVLAYDELQTIFQTSSPDSAQLFGVDIEGKPNATFEEDIVLHKCYRNPREVLVTAHSIGFGIYGERIVQMIENKDHWNDVGYNVKQGDFIENSEMLIERPKENSLTVISDGQDFDAIVHAEKFESVAEETENVANQVKEVLEDGLRPEDVLIVTVDDRNAKTYLNVVERALAARGIMCNNLHSDSFGIRDFTKEGRVTLSTVHKAKGNEAFIVFVMGCNSVMERPNVRSRNMLFTAMTRAKGWLRISGIESSQELLQHEVSLAKENFPNLKFKYPGPAQLKIMKRDLAEVADKKMKMQRLLEQLREEASDEEINDMLSMESSRLRTPKKRKR